MRRQSTRVCRDCGAPINDYNASGLCRSCALKARWARERPTVFPNPSGLCQCGCGQRTRIATTTIRSKGHVRGQPVRYLPGHSNSPNIRYEIDPSTGCWIWRGRLTTNGYGHITLHGRQVTAHVMMYTQKYGPIPPGKELDHVVCQNRACVNPDHLEPVSHAINMQRSRFTRLTPEAVREIRRLRPQTPLRVLAERYGVSMSAISRAALGQTWREMEGVADHGSGTP